MYLQGDLQTVFDALYHMGVIDPVLEMDWGHALDQIAQHIPQIDEAVNVANHYQSDLERLMTELRRFDQKTLGYLAMEVAREYADFHSRDELH